MIFQVPKPRFCLALLVLLVGLHTQAAIRYVDAQSPNPSRPYTSWASAARTIQDAVNAASSGDEIMVTNGVYDTGSRAVQGTMRNRLAVTRAVTIRSVQGPEVTIIQGSQVPNVIHGNQAVRCVWLGRGATLSGFTLTQGATRAEGDFVTQRSGGGVWCESVTSVVTNCILEANAAYSRGGGVYGGTLYDCLLLGNHADLGGGAARSVLYRCTIRDNSAHQGGGVEDGESFGCFLTGNEARQGGGAWGGMMIQSTVTGNRAHERGGGLYETTAENCVVYFNSAPTELEANYFQGELRYSCTTPLPNLGTGNIADDPQIAGASHLSEASPCRGSGLSPARLGADLDDEPWRDPPSMGCDEVHPESAAGPLRVAMSWTSDSFRVGAEVRFLASVEGRPLASRWEFEGGPVLSNQPYASHQWMAPGAYTVILRAFNQTYPAGISVTSVVQILDNVYFVSLLSTNPVAPYESWSTAATNIQDAVDAAMETGALILVSNGVYQAGGRAVHGIMTNRLTVEKPLMVRSLNGPSVTVIRGFQVPGITNGDGAIRCVYLANGASLSGFTLSGGATGNQGDQVQEQSGGGLYSEDTAGRVFDCVFADNWAQRNGGGVYGAWLEECVLENNLAAMGGGVHSSRLTNCIVRGNYSFAHGGGANACVLTDCLITSNRGVYGGGASYSTLLQCRVYGNLATSIGGGTHGSTVEQSELRENRASFQGGGAFGGSLHQCILAANSSGNDGGGAESSTLIECLLQGNSSGDNGGGAHESRLTNCRIVGNTTRNEGGGAESSNLTGCVVMGNTAGTVGGGVDDSFLYNCLVVENMAKSYGGGAYESGLYQCTLAANVAGNAGGIYAGIISNSVVYFNSATTGTNHNFISGRWGYSCTAPIPAIGSGNISLAPSFVDPTNGNYRMNPDSLCIDAGLNGVVLLDTDLDRRPRLVNTRVDIGAYEYQTAVPGEFLGWLESRGYPTDGTFDAIDDDGDQADTYEEWRAGTDPEDSESVLRLHLPIWNGSDLILTWASVADRRYLVQGAADGAMPRRFQSLGKTIQGQAGTTSYRLTNALASPYLMIRIEVE